MPRKKTSSESASTAGTYAYDKELGKVVKVSDRIPGVSSKGKGRGADAGPCGRSACAGGACAGGLD